MFESKQQSESTSDKPHEEPLNMKEQGLNNDDNKNLFNNERFENSEENKAVDGDYEPKLPNVHHEVIVESNKDIESIDKNELEDQMHEDQEMEDSDNSHLKHQNIPNKESSDSEEGGKELHDTENIDSLEKSTSDIPQDHFEKQADIDNDIDKDFKEMETNIQDTLTEIVKELDKQEVIQKINLESEQTVSGKTERNTVPSREQDNNKHVSQVEEVKTVEERNENLDKQYDVHSEFDHEVIPDDNTQHEPLEKDKTADDVEQVDEDLEEEEDEISETNNNANEQQTERPMLGTNEEIIHIVGGLDEPEISNTGAPGTKFTEETKSNEDESILNKEEDSTINKENTINKEDGRSTTSESNIETSSSSDETTSHQDQENKKGKVLD